MVVISWLIRFVVFLGFLRLKSKLSNWLDTDLSEVTLKTSRNLNLYWDLSGFNYPQQDHHRKVDAVMYSIFGSMQILWLLFISIMPWEVLKKEK
jgi:hypothetical protein